MGSMGCQWYQGAMMLQTVFSAMNTLHFPSFSFANYVKCDLAGMQALLSFRRNFVAIFLAWGAGCKKLDMYPYPPP